MDYDPSPSRRRLLAGVAAVGTTALAGCVTTELSVDAPDVDGSPVFESFSVTNGVVWAGDSARVKATLTDAATTDRKVRELSVITASGGEAWTGTVSGGQTSVTMQLPVGKELTVHAFDASSNPIDAQSLRVGGDSFP